MARVAMAEAFLFAGVAALLVWFAISSPLESIALRVLELTLVLAFGFAALRAAIWSAGAPVLAANLITLGSAVLIGLGYLVWRRRAQRH
jgi:hypothetical protein